MRYSNTASELVGLTNSRVTVPRPVETSVTWGNPFAVLIALVLGNTWAAAAEPAGTTTKAIPITAASSAATPRVRILMVVSLIVNTPSRVVIGAIVKKLEANSERSTPCQ